MAGTVLQLGTTVDGKQVASADITGTIFTVPDSTGDYVAVTNEGGYGAPNPERTDYGLFLFAFYRSSDGLSDSQFELANNDPNSVTSVDITAVKDGHIEVTGVLVLKVVGSPNEGDYRYNNGVTLQQYLSAVWVDVVDELDLIDSTSGNLIKAVLDIPVVTFTTREYYNTLAELYEDIMPGEKCGDFELLTHRKNELAGRLESAIYQFNAGNFNQFQSIMEGLNQYVASFKS